MLLAPPAGLTITAAVSFALFAQLVFIETSRPQFAAHVPGDGSLASFTIGSAITFSTLAQPIFIFASLPQLLTLLSKDCEKPVIGKTKRAAAAVKPSRNLRIRHPPSTGQLRNSDKFPPGRNFSFLGPAAWRNATFSRLRELSLLALCWHKSMLVAFAAVLLVASHLFIDTRSAKQLGAAARGSR